MLPAIRKFQLLQTCSNFIRSVSTTHVRFNVEDNDEPIVLEKNPYSKPKRKCILCEHKILLDYKNTRLLQQFVSTFSGRVYERHVTGLCTKQHKRLLDTIALSRRSGYMPIFVKDPKYLNDPKLFDPLKPLTPHSYA
jgi:small subunit ribosomal protein S18